MAVFVFLLSRYHSITRPPRAEAFILFMAVTSSSIVAVTGRAYRFVVRMLVLPFFTANKHFWNS